MAPITVYGMKASAPVRIVLMTCEVLGVDYEFKEIDLMKGENKTPEYLAINPQHNIPAMVDGDLKMNESRAIANYLASAYAKQEAKLVPKDAKARARVDQLMYFDMGTFYYRFGQCVYPRIFEGLKEIPTAKMEALHEVLGWVNGFLDSTGYVAGTDHLTLADICIVSTLTTLKECQVVPDLADKYPNLIAFIERMTKEIPNYESANGQWAAAFGEWAKSKMQD